MWLVGISEPTLSVNTKFYLFDFNSCKIVKVDLRGFYAVAPKITNASVGKRLRLLSGDIAELPVFNDNGFIKNPYHTILYAKMNRGIKTGYAVMNYTGVINEYSVNDVRNALLKGVKFVNATIENNKVVPLVKSFGFVLMDNNDSFMYDIDSLLQNVIEQAKVIGVPVAQTISRSVNITNGLLGEGSCERDTVSGWYRISINRKFIKSANQICNILAHEIIHTCPNCKHHNDTFRKYAKEMYDTYGYTMERCKEEKSSSGDMHYIKCKRCGYITVDNGNIRDIANSECHYCKCIGTLYRVLRG